MTSVHGVKQRLYLIRVRKMARMQNCQKCQHLTRLHQARGTISYSGIAHSTGGTQNDLEASPGPRAVKNKPPRGHGTDAEMCSGTYRAHYSNVL
jgi:hypothetical protein